MYVKPYGYISWWISKSPLLRHFKFDTADLHQKKHGNSLATSKVSLSKVEKIYLCCLNEQSTWGLLKAQKNQ